MIRLLEILTYVAAVLAGIFLFLTVGSANGAPQEAAGAAMAVAIAVIPYCICATMQRRRMLNRDQAEPSSPAS